MGGFCAQTRGRVLHPSCSLNVLFVQKYNIITYNTKSQIVGYEAGGGDQVNRFL